MDKEIEAEAPAEQHQQTKKTVMERVLFFGLIPLVVVLLLAVGYLVKELRSNSDTATGNGGPVFLYGDPNLQGGNGSASSTPTPTESLEQPIADHGPEIWVSVAWTNPWKAVTTDCGSNNESCTPDYAKHYSAGTIIDGAYKGQTIYIQEEQTLGSTYSYFVKSDGKNIYFYAANIQIRGIDDLPETINLPGGNQTFKLSLGNYFRYNEVKRGAKIMSHVNIGDLYLAIDEGCLVAQLPNGLAVAYSPEVPFVPKDSGVPQISFTSGGTNADTYNFIRPTCGGLCTILQYIDEKTLKPENRLSVVGTASNGELIYGLKDPNDQALKDIYNDKNTVPYTGSTPNPDGSWQQSKSKYTYAQFLALHPLVYWKDGLGRWIEFRNQRVAVAAEMCKPVIYLYPTKPTNLEVYVAPNGGFTKTIPEYGTGWKVTADPTGKIVDRKTGKVYDYLFWEGIGMQYPQPEDGFVIATKDAASFFDTMLPKLGLAGKEITDFKEYWVARLQNTGKPYALVHFMDDNTFSALAPVRIAGPQPNSLIRVMMTAKVLDSRINIPEQKLEPTPKRAGFVYAEWGGALLQ